MKRENGRLSRRDLRALHAFGVPATTEYAAVRALEQSRTPQPWDFSSNITMYTGTSTISDNFRWSNSTTTTGNNWTVSLYNNVSLPITFAPGAITVTLT